jgi:hypothetical protein
MGVYPARMKSTSTPSYCIAVVLSCCMRTKKLLSSVTILYPYVAILYGRIKGKAMDVYLLVRQGLK